MGTSDDLPIFRPQMGGGRRPTSSGGVKGFRNSVLSSVRQNGRGSPDAVAARTARGCELAMVTVRATQIRGILTTWPRTPERLGRWEGGWAADRSYVRTKLTAGPRLWSNRCPVSRLARPVFRRIGGLAGAPDFDRARAPGGNGSTRAWARHRAPIPRVRATDDRAFRP